MEKSTIQVTPNELEATELETAIKQSADDLLKWLAGSTKYFVKSMKVLAENSNDQALFRSYVTMRLFNHVQQLAEIADIHAKKVEQTDEENTENYCNVRKKPLDANNVERFYNRYITSILAENKDVYNEICNILTVMRNIDGSGDHFGLEVKNFLNYHLTMLDGMSLGQQGAYMLCLVMAVKSFKFEDMGKHGKYIEEIIDRLSAIVCAIVSMEYDNRKRYK